MFCKFFFNLRAHFGGLSTSLLALCGAMFLLSSFSPLFSADRIAFVAPSKTGWQLFTTDPSGSNTRQLTSGEYDVRLPDWFPDRAQIVFTTTGGISYIVKEATGTIIDTIISSEYYFWQASADKDGSAIYLVAGKPKEIDQTFVTRYDLRTKKLITDFRLNTPVYDIDVSPIDNSILFGNNLCGSICGHVIQEIWLKNADDHSVRQMHIRNAMSSHPCWLPDAEGFLFDSEVGNRKQLFRQTIGSLEPAILLKTKDLKGDFTQPTVSPDGNEVAFLKNGLLFISSLKTPDNTKQITPFLDKPDTRIKDPKW